MKKQYQSGSVHAVIVICLVAALIAALVFIFLQNFVLNPTNKSTETTSNQVSTNTTNSTQPTDPNKGYIVLDDWGVRFKPVDSSTIKYYKDTTSGDIYEFTTTTLENLAGCTSGAAGARTNSFAGLLERSKTKLDLQNMASPPTALNNGDKIGDYYYYYGHPQSVCSTTNADTKTEVAQVEIIQKLLSTIEQKQ